MWSLPHMCRTLLRVNRATSTVETYLPDQLERPVGILLHSSSNIEDYIKIIKPTASPPEEGKSSIISHFHNKGKSSGELILFLLKTKKKSGKSNIGKGILWLHFLEIILAQYIERLTAWERLICKNVCIVSIVCDGFFVCLVGFVCPMALHFNE